MKRIWLALGLACLACCLPLIVPMLAGAGIGLGAWSVGLGWTEIACLALIAAAVAIATLVIVRRRGTDGPTCDMKD